MIFRRNILHFYVITIYCKCYSLNVVKTKQTKIVSGSFDRLSNYYTDMYTYVQLSTAIGYKFEDLLHIQIFCQIAVLY